MNSEDMKVVVSEKWGAEDAGKEISKKLSDIDNLKLLMVFSTIHYKDHGGFEKLLKSIYGDISEEVRLVGGNVTGFMTKENNFTHGVVCLAISGDDFDFSIGIGENTKRSPDKSGSKAANKVKQDLHNSDYDNRFLISMISATEVLKFPFSRPRNILQFNLPDKVWHYFLKFFRKVFQKGFGQEDKILNKINEILPDYDLVGLSTVDDKMIVNYQFVDKNILRNSIVLLGMAIPEDYDTGFATGAKKSKYEFNITKMNKDKDIIHEINGKPALDELISIMDWQKDVVLDERRWVSILPRFPIGYYSQDEIVLRPMILIMGQSIGFMSSFDNEDAFVTLMSGQDLLEAMDETTSKKGEFSFIISCAIRGMGLGKYVDDIRRKLNKRFKNKDFLLIYTGGEAYKEKGKSPEYLTESIVTLNIK